jgi:hypothetical protein
VNSDCPQASLVSQLVDNELSDGERASLLEHLAQCEVCTREMDNLMRLCSTLALLSADPSAKQRVRNALSSKQTRMSFAGRRLLVPLPIAATIMLMLGASVIGNAYWQFFRPVREQIVYRSVYLPNRVSNPAKETDEVKKTVDPAARQQETADSQSIDSGVSRKRHNRVNASSIEPGVKTFIATLKTDRYIAEFSTTTRYMLYPIPKIYSGGLNFSEQRGEQ